jgi:nitroimidazol reductase NimA-like FMN-containing flavoprotein (pyridoxamine 5'-phosphate oxidase superfamily)
VPQRVDGVGERVEVVLPVNFAVAGNTIVFRTAPGGVIAAHADGSQSVTFEVDHVDEALEQGWSVVIQGIACRIAGPAELSAAAQDVDVRPWAGGGRDAYIRIFPYRISGRRITPLAS